MSEEITQELSELLVTEPPEAGSEPASTTSTGEESTLDPDTLEKPIAEDQKEKQIASLMRKMDSGELTLDDLKKSKQKWAAEEIERRQSKAKKEAEKAEEIDVDAIVERKLKEKQDEQDFKDAIKEINSMNITDEEREAFTLHYKDLRSGGLPKSRLAVEKAKLLAGLGSAVKRPSPSIPSRQVVEERKADTLEAIMKLPEEKRIAKLKELTL